MATRSVRLGRLLSHAASARRLEMRFRQSHSRALSVANSTLPLPSGEVARVAAYPSETSTHTLTEQQLEFRTLAQNFALEELLPNAARWDELKHFPVDTLRKAAALGFGGLYCKEDVGGSGLGRADAAVIFETLAYADVSTSAYLTIHNMCCSIIDRFGTPEQRHHWLPHLTTMDHLSSYCLTEPESGSDAASLLVSCLADKCTPSGRNNRLLPSGLQGTAGIWEVAQRKDEEVLGGWAVQAFISGGGVSDVYLVMARTGEVGPGGITCFIVEKGTPGLSFGAQEKKMGWNSQPTVSVHLDDVRVPVSHRVGGEGQGFKIAMAGLDGGRINIGACSVGGAQFCLDKATQHGLDRKQFGKRLADFQSWQFRLADMATEVEASRLMVRNAATAADEGAPWATSAAAMAKRFATDACYNVANQAVQALGGYGYLKDYDVERYVRDLRVHSILEGTNEIMRVIISRHLLRNARN